MLYNPNWKEAQVGGSKWNGLRRLLGLQEKFQPSVKGCLAWAKTKAPNERYSYRNSENCANAQYHRAIGLTAAQYRKWLVRDSNVAVNAAVNAIERAAASDRFPTFGDFVRRLEKVCA